MYLHQLHVFTILLNVKFKLNVDYRNGNSESGNKSKGWQ